MGSIKNVQFGKNVSIVEPTNLYGCKIGDNVKIGPFVEIQRDSEIGDDSIVSSHSFIPSGVKIGNNVYKILNDGTVYTSVSNFNKLKNLNIQSVNDLNQDDIFVFQSHALISK